MSSFTSVTVFYYATLSKSLNCTQVARYQDQGTRVFVDIQAQSLSSSLLIKASDSKKNRKPSQTLLPRRTLSSFPRAMVKSVPAKTPEWRFKHFTFTYKTLRQIFWVLCQLHCSLKISGFHVYNFPFIVENVILQDSDGNWNPSFL